MFGLRGCVDISRRECLVKKPTDHVLGGIGLTEQDGEDVVRAIDEDLDGLDERFGPSP